MGHVVSCINPHRPDCRGENNSPAGRRMHAEGLRKRVSRLFFNRSELSNGLRSFATDKEDVTSGSVSVSLRAHAAPQRNSEQGRVATNDYVGDFSEAANESMTLKRKSSKIETHDRSLWEAAHAADARLQRLLDLEARAEESKLDYGALCWPSGHQNAKEEEKEVIGKSDLKVDGYCDAPSQISHERTFVVSVIACSADENALDSQKKVEDLNGAPTDRLLSVREGIALFDAEAGSRTMMPSNGIYVRKLEATSGQHKFKYSDPIDS